MKTATENLENDHNYILQLTETMEKIAELEEPHVADLEEVVDLIRNFADGMHHTKEENFLFPLLGEKGFSREQGPVAVMLNEHTQGRNYVKGMIENISLHKEGDKTALGKVYANMSGYAELLRNHITKENNILFRMADNVFSEQEQQDLLTEFVKIENANLPAGRQSFISRIEKLAGNYL